MSGCAQPADQPMFVEFLELRPDSAVLEVGSGLGILAGEVAARVPGDEVIGVEYSPDQLAAAKINSPRVRETAGRLRLLLLEPHQRGKITLRNNGPSC